MAESPLTLVPNKEGALNEAHAYGKMFHFLADQVNACKGQAAALMKEALERGVEPAEMAADYSLVDLDLAEVSEVASIDGMPVVEYLEPE